MERIKIVASNLSTIVFKGLRPELIDLNMVRLYTNVIDNTNRNVHVMFKERLLNAL